MRSAYNISLVPLLKLCNGCNVRSDLLHHTVALPMTVIVKYSITPTESAKFEVTMKVSVKN